MRFSTLTISLAVAGALALPQAELKKRQAVTVVETVTVTTTVSGNPYVTPAWKGPPKFLGAPDRGGPDGDPPKWTPPRLGQGRPTIAPDPGPYFVTEISSSSQAASVNLVSNAVWCFDHKVSFEDVTSIEKDVAENLGDDMTDITPALIFANACWSSASLVS